MFHILSSLDLSNEFFRYLFENYNQNFQSNIKESLGVLIFEEPSTRTKESFSLAFANLGIKAIDIHLQNSSTSKGETIYQTIDTLQNYAKKVVIVFRTGKAIITPPKCEYFINAGDGSHEHPTQALADILTIFQVLNCKFSPKFLDGINITICGDIQNSRVARSNVKLLHKFGAKITLVAPCHLMSKFTMEHFSSSFDCAFSHILTDEIIANSQFLMFLRNQNERQNQFIDTATHQYSMMHDRLQKLSHNSYIMHPGPVNIGAEICVQAFAHKNSLINKQVQNALIARTHLISWMLNS